MKKIVWILSIFLFSTISIQATNNTTEQKLFEQNYQLQQQKEQIKELEDKLRKYTDDKVEDSNKRVDIINGSVDKFGIIISLIGTLVTVLLVVVAWSSRNTAITTAREESQKLIDNWIKTKADNDFKQLAETKLNEKLNDFESKADNQFKAFEKKYKVELNKIKHDVEIVDLRQDSENLYNKAYQLGQEEKFEDEIKAYDNLINKYKNSKNKYVQNALVFSMNNKGTRLAEIGKISQAIIMFDDVISKFKDSNIDSMQTQVARAMGNKFIALWLENKKIEAIKVYKTLTANYKDSKIDSVIAEVAHVMMNQYEFLIIDNKTLSKEEKEWIKNTNLKLEYRASFGLLEIIDNAKKISQDVEVAKWLEDYKDVKYKTWRFKELRNWIVGSSYEDEIKNRISSYIDTFEKAFS